jgi:YVTN family beta-propeller protein
VSVIDTTTSPPKVTATITVGSYPVGVAVSPDGSTVYVANEGDNSVSVIDTTTNPPTVTATIGVGNQPIAFGLFIGPPPPSSTLMITETGTGSGMVTSSPSGISCGNGHTQCTAQFANGTQITLHAAASAGSVFTGWTNTTCSADGTSPCQLTLNANTTVTANFASIPSYMLSVSVAGSGTVTSNPSGINCRGASCSASFQFKAARWSR